MTKNEIDQKLTKLSQMAAAIDDAMLRAEVVEAAEEARQAVAEWPEPPDPEWLQEDYANIRRFIIEERRMRQHVFQDRPQTRTKKVGACDTAGMALNRMARALGLSVQAPLQPPVAPVQAQLISAPSREVVA